MKNRGQNKITKKHGILSFAAVVSSFLAAVLVMGLVISGINPQSKNPNNDIRESESVSAGMYGDTMIGCRSFETISAVRGNWTGGSSSGSTGGRTVTGGTRGSAAFIAEFSMSSSWDSNGKINCQYNVTIKNISQYDMKSWSVQTAVPSGTRVTQSWGCQCTVSGTKLTVKAVDYTASVKSGASQGSIGFIMETSGIQGSFSVNGVSNDIEGGNTGSGSTGGGSSQDDKPYTPPKVESGTPVGNHGQLSVKGTNLVDKNGRKYQLKGVSTHGIGWFPDYVNQSAFKTLRDNWGANFVRIAMYTDEYNGYCSGGDKAKLEALVSQGVESCTNLGMYVMIDWHILHDNNPNQNIEAAKTFFDKMSKKYSKNVNVLYEICNEPNGGTTWADIKKFP